MLTFFNIILLIFFITIFSLFLFVLKEYYRMRKMVVEINKEEVNRSEATNLYFAGKISVEEYEKYLSQGGRI